jgi:hypothetical protein
MSNLLRPFQGSPSNLSRNRTQRPLSNLTYNELDFRSPSNFSLAVGPAFLRRWAPSTQGPCLG